MQQDILNIVPRQQTGKEIEVNSSCKFEQENEAVDFFTVAKGRLLNVDQWHRVAGVISAAFRAFDKDGNKVDRKIEKEDYMRIDIPGPGSKEGDGYDWVKIEEVKEVEEAHLQCIGFRVRPAANPCGDTNSIAHFYDDSATGNFVVTREGKKITATVIDVNVKPNDDTNSITDKIRGTAIGTVALSFFSKLQWKNLVDGIVKIEK
jgi:hypothetical protein